MATQFRAMSAIALAATLSGCGGSASHSILPSSTRVSQGHDGGNNNGVVVTPTALMFASPAADPQTFVATQQFQGYQNAVSDDASCATVSPGAVRPSVTPKDSGEKSATFVVTPVSGGCTTTITVTDKKGNTGTVAVIVAPNAPRLAYVSDFNDQTVQVVNLITGAVVQTINVGGGPNGLVVTNGKVFVTNNVPGGGIFEIDALTYAVTNLLEGGGPAAIVANVPGTIVFAADYFNHSVTSLSATSGQQLNRVSNAGPRPADLAINASGTRIYEMPNDGTLNVIDTTVNAIVATVQLGSGFGGNGVLLSPNGSTAYVAGTSRGSGIAVVDTVSNSLTTIMTSAQLIDRIAMNSDGSKVYGFCDDGTVQIFDTATRALSGTVSLSISSPNRIGASKDRKTLYVPTNANGILVLDADTLNVLKVIALPNAQAVAV
jgi:DNA-binding beta-propeller fold protein YncE